MAIKIKTSFLLIVFIFNTRSCIHAQDKTFSIELGPEYSNTDFRWSIAGNMAGTGPNILSELTYRPVHGAGWRGKANYHFSRKFSAGLGYATQYFFKGEATDIDYQLDNRTGVRSALYLQSNRGASQTFQAGVDFKAVEKNNFALLLGLGYRATKEIYYLSDRNDGTLKTTYKTWWNGHYTSLQLTYKPAASYEVGAGLQYNNFGRWPFVAPAGTLKKELFSYYAEAGWNNRDDFRQPLSFVHAAKANGFDGNLSFGYWPKDFLKINARATFSHWKTGFGIDELYKADGEIIRARMNGAIRKNTTVSVSAELFF